MCYLLRKQQYPVNTTYNITTPQRQLLAGCNDYNVSQGNTLDASGIGIAAVVDSDQVFFISNSKEKLSE